MRINYYENREQYLEYKKEYYLENKEKLSKVKKEYRKENSEKIRMKNKKYRDDNIEKVRENRRMRYKERVKSDLLYVLKRAISSSIRKSLNDKKLTKEQRTEYILGCTIIDFQIYLEGKFEDWMTWKNRGLYNGELYYGWDIDHKIPLSTAKTEDDIIKLNHFTNFQPLCSHINRNIKRDKVNYK
jgi:hypothetical protein